jgi:hypothetical protein
MLIFIYFSVEFGPIAKNKIRQYHLLFGEWQENGNTASTNTQSVYFHSLCFQSYSNNHILGRSQLASKKHFGGNNKEVLAGTAHVPEAKR